METQELYTTLAFVAATLLGVVLGAVIAGKSAKQTIEEIKANKELVNDWTGKLADAIPPSVLKTVNNLALNAQDVTRFVLAAQFPGVPFTSQIKEVAEIAANVADIVEDATDGEKEPIAPFANKGIPQQPAA